jgi:hypothetical protein
MQLAGARTNSLRHAQMTIPCALGMTVLLAALLTPAQRNACNSMTSRREPSALGCLRRPIARVYTFNA